MQSASVIFCMTIPPPLHVRRPAVPQLGFMPSPFSQNGILLSAILCVFPARCLLKNGLAVSEDQGLLPFFQQATWSSAFDSLFSPLCAPHSELQRWEMTSLHARGGFLG